MSASPTSSDEVEAIRQLKARYCRFLDTKDYDTWRGLFAPEVVVKLDLRCRAAGPTRRPWHRWKVSTRSSPS
jgi:3-phenylpropionate/cinnamic acid dioxygenase small subunit